MADGRVHGVFTWTLLKGLHGGASDERGYATAESLRTFLYAVMPEFLPDDARTDATIDLQPFVRADDGISFHRLPARPKYPVHLTIPEASAGEELKIWSHRPPAQVVSDAARRERVDRGTGARPVRRRGAVSSAPPRIPS